MPNGSSNRPYRVLIVEDNPDDSSLLLRAFRQAQADFATEIAPEVAPDSACASQLLLQQKFDAVFVDNNMPPPDGVELTRQARAGHMNRTTAIVMITGSEDRGLMARAFQAGVNFFLFKPINRAQLLRLIQMSSASIDRERRKVQRIKVSCKAMIESEAGRFDGETLDLSLNGMLFRSSRVLPVGSIANIHLTLPPATAPIRITARVVRTIGNEFTGLQFQSVGKLESEKLAVFLVPLIVAASEE